MKLFNTLVNVSWASIREKGKSLDRESWRVLLSLTIEAIAVQKGDIALLKEKWCGISQGKSQVQGEVCASSEKPRCNKSPSHSKVYAEGRYNIIKRLNWLTKVKRNLGCYRTWLRTRESSATPFRITSSETSGRSVVCCRKGQWARGFVGTLQ